jgi:hypothetical protein
MPTFQRNLLSPSSGAEVTRQVTSASEVGDSVLLQNVGKCKQMFNVLEYLMYKVLLQSSIVVYVIKHLPSQIQG